MLFRREIVPLDEPSKNFIEACKKGDLTQVCSTPEPIVLKNLIPALLETAEHGRLKIHVQIMEFLISRPLGSYPIEEINRAIRKAAEHGYLFIVARLMGVFKNSNPGAQENYAIIKAAENGHTNMVKLLATSLKVDPAAKDSLALKKAAENGHLEVVKFLLEDGRVKPEAESNYAFRWAVIKNHLDLAKVLSQYSSVDPTAINHCVLECAAEKAEKSDMNMLNFLCSLPKINPVEGINKTKSKEIKDFFRRQAIFRSAPGIPFFIAQVDDLNIDTKREIISKVIKLELNAHPELYKDFFQIQNHLINPNLLQFAGKPMVSADLLGLMKKKSIELKLQSFDSDPDDHEKPVLVFIHGNSSSKAAFDSQIEHFKDRYRLISIDLIGHGQSTKLNKLAQLSHDEKELLAQAFYTLPAMVGQIAQVLQQKQIKAAHFLGWSLGGHLAYGLAVEYPELVASIISIGSPPVRFSSKGLISGFNDWFVETLVPKWVEQPEPIPYDEARDIREKIGFSKNDSYFVEDLRTTDPLVRRHLFLNINGYEHSSYDQTVIDGDYFAKTSKIPLCLIVGDQDQGINHQFILSFSGKLMNEHSMIKIIPNGKHAVFKTNPKEYFEIVDEFLTTNQPSATFKMS